MTPFDYLGSIEDPFIQVMYNVLYVLFICVMVVGIVSIVRDYRKQFPIRVRSKLTKHGMLEGIVTVLGRISDTSKKSYVRVRVTFTNAAGSQKYYTYSLPRGTYRIVPGEPIKLRRKGVVYSPINS